jgi:hypothetical protein
LFSAVSLVGVDKAQAAVLTYNIGDSSSLSFLKVDTSSLTGIGVEEVPVLEGRYYGFTLGPLFKESKEYYNLAGFKVLFYQGDFRGLQAGGSDYGRTPPNEPGAPYSYRFTGSTYWSIGTNYLPSDMWVSLLSGYVDIYFLYGEDSISRFYRSIVRDTPVYYTLVNTEREPVPEPLTAGGTALALAGLSWLKHKKKMAA